MRIRTHKFSVTTAVAVLALSVTATHAHPMAPAAQADEPEVEVVLPQTTDASEAAGEAVIPTVKEVDSGTAKTLDRSRSLLRALRSRQPVSPQPPVVLPQGKLPPGYQKLSSNDKNAPNPILLTGGEDTDGVVVLSDDMPETAVLPDNTVSGSVNVLPGNVLPGNVVVAPIDANSALCVPACDCPKCRARKQYRKNGKPKSGRMKRFIGNFVERYDPELERLDTNDYDHQALLVSEATVTQEKKARSSEIFSRKITDIKPTLDYAWGRYDEEELPTDFHKDMDNGPFVATVAPQTVLQWEPTNLWYYPLYFEDVGLERYGHTRRPWVQPFVSTGRFMGQVIGLPYQMALHPPKCREFALGHYQPGEWAPKKRYRIPFNEEAAATQFLWMTGFVLLIP